MLVSGPANCGKTATAHALLNLVDAAGTKIWTAERPGKPMRTGASQVEVNEDIGWDFPSIMKAIVRADPDVILLGEMHDRETGALAVQAALRGCRVIATVDGGSAAEALSGLIDLGLEPYDPARVHGHRLTLGACDRMLGTLAALPLDERRQVPGLHPDRAPTIVAGAVILAQSMRAFGLESVEASEADILHGVALESASTG